MYENFIEQTLEFLKYSVLRCHPPSIEEIVIKEDGTRISSLTGFAVTGATEIKPNLPLVISVLFVLPDVVVDRRYSGLEGLSFKQRYFQLPFSSDDQRILREVYRIMKLKAAIRVR